MPFSQQNYKFGNLFINPSFSDRLNVDFSVSLSGQMILNCLTAVSQLIEDEFRLRTVNSVPDRYCVIAVFDIRVPFQVLKNKSVYHTTLLDLVHTLVADDAFLSLSCVLTKVLEF